MKYVTLDMELADRMLPSICSITIIEWEDGKITKILDTYINPDCEVESFFSDRHGITNEMLIDAPTLPEKWIEIYDALNHKMVFSHFANRTIKALKQRASVDQLLMPNMRFGDSASIAKRTWPRLEDYRLPYLTEILNITKFHNNSYEDAKSVAKIVDMSAELYDVYSSGELFKTIGYAGGIIKNQEKISYKAIKDKKNNIYIPNYDAYTKKERPISV